MTVGQDLFEAGQIYLFRLRNGNVLFRVDGLVVSLDEATASRLITGPDERVSAAGRTEDVATALHDLRAEGVFDRVLDSRPFPSAHDRAAGILLMLTQTCNLACTYCYGDGGTYGSRVASMDLKTAERAIDMMLARAPERGRFTVTFFGGEPLLRFDLVRAIVEACEERTRATGKQFHYSITTNGTLVTDEIAKFLADKRFGVMASYDGPRSRHRLFRNRRPSIGRVTRGIRRLVKCGAAVQLRATMARGGEPASAIVSSVASLGARSICISPASDRTIAGGPGKSLELAEEEIERFELECREMSRAHFRNAMRGESEPVIFDAHLSIVRALAKGEGRNFSRCGACLGGTAVSTSGRLYPCHRFVGAEPYAIGDLDSGVDVERVGHFFTSFGSAMRDACSGCWARVLCGGGCYHAASDGKGGFVPPSADGCERLRGRLKFAVELFLAIRTAPPAAARQLAVNAGYLKPETC